jgi:nicotinamide phosphoribosyltransferase
VLPPQIRVIQGDGIDYGMIKNIYEMLQKNKVAANNLVFGMGGALLQKLNRDTQKFALKCSYAEVSGKPIEVMKSPVEMDEQGAIHQSFKTSKAGRLKLVKTTSGLKTVKENENGTDLLETVFENGELTNPVTFEEIRNRAKISNNVFNLN